MKHRVLYIPLLHIDSNLINARQKIPAINQLEKWTDDEIICINMSSTPRNEARAEYDSNRTRKDDEQIHTFTPPAEASNHRYKQIEAAIFPGGAKNKNQHNAPMCKNNHNASKFIKIDNFSNYHMNL